MNSNWACAAARSCRTATSSLLEGLLDLLYPRHCAGCERSLHDQPGAYLCADCEAELPFVAQPTCPRCGHEIGELAAQKKRCPDCRGKTLNFISASAPFRYDGAAQRMILQLKLAHQHYLAGLLGTYLVDHLRGFEFKRPIDAIVPVPLHWKRRLRRGFNQAELIARQVSPALNIPVIAGCLVRKVHAASQTTRHHNARLRSIQNAFAVRHPDMIRDKTVLLIDDVLTTGATCAECSRVLRQGGASGVYVVTIARTMRYR